MLVSIPAKNVPIEKANNTLLAFVEIVRPSHETTCHISNMQVPMIIKKN